MLDFYAKRFRTVELNFSYYRMPTERTTSSMVRRTPQDFLFTIKAHGDFTHQGERTPEGVAEFKRGTAPLVDNDRLGALLFQFPYAFKNTPENQDYMRLLWDDFRPWPLVVEFRHRSWMTEEVFDLLREEQVGFCCVDEPDLPGLPPSVVAATSDVAYIRFHGRNRKDWWSEESRYARYNYSYTEEELTEWVDNIWGLAKQATSTFVFFNNHVNGQAPMNAEMLMSLMGLPVPKLLGDEPGLFG
jgi:uncharacterized protein YecE (DUF72 family)